MKTIQDWLDDDSNYNEGVLLYIQLPHPSRNLVRLFTLKETNYNRNKLKQELKKHAKTSVISKQKPIIKKRKIEIFIDGSPKTTSVERNFKRVTLNMLPQELHQVFIDQKNRFLTNCALKIQLNNLRYNATAQALKIILEIDSNYAFIDLAWKQIDHWLENKVLLPTTTQDYSALSPVQLLRTLNNKEASISKLKKRIATYKLDLKSANQKLKNSLKIKLERSTRLLFEHTQNLQKIKTLIDG